MRAPVRRIHRAAAAALLVSLVACGGGGGAAAGAGGADPGPGPVSQPGVIALTVGGGAALTMAPGASGTLGVTVSRGGSFTGPVTLSVEGAQAGVTATLAPASLDAGVTASTLSVTLAAGATPGISTLTVRARGTGVADATYPVALTVRAPAGGVGVSLGSATLAVARGATATVPVTVSRSGSFGGDVALSVEGLPSGVTASFAPTALGAGVTASTLTLSASTAAAVGGATITVRAQGTGVTDATASLALAVSSPTTTVTLAVSTPDLVVARGQMAVTHLGIAPSTLASPVTATVSGAPAGLSATFYTHWSATTGTPTFQFYSGGNTVPELRVAPDASTPLGTYTLAIRGSSASAADATTSVRVTVVDPQASVGAGWTQIDLTGNAGGCGVRNGGRAYCWVLEMLGTFYNGLPGYGQLVPVDVAGSLRFRKLAVSSLTACGLATDDRIYCFGSNSSGALGIGSTTPPNSFVPVEIAGGRRYRDVTTSGGGTFCALDTGGSAWCWGYYAVGELGDGRAQTSNSTEPTPVAVSGGHVFASLHGSTSTTCGIKTSGEVWCWGLMLWRSPSSSPVPVNVGAPASIAAFPAGNGFCVLSTAGKPYCTGVGASILLDGRSGTASTLTAVSTPLTFASMHFSGAHACGVTAAGELYCWGSSEYGQVGTGQSGSTARAVPMSRIASGTTFQSVETMTYHTCAVTTAGRAYCWGYNSNGQVGDGTKVMRTTPVPVVAY